MRFRRDDRRRRNRPRLLGGTHGNDTPEPFTFRRSGYEQTHRPPIRTHAVYPRRVVVVRSNRLRFGNSVTDG